MTDTPSNAPAVDAVKVAREAATEIVMGRGLVDVGDIHHEGRSGILFRPRSNHIPVGEPGEVAGKYWPVSGDVVIWIENKGGAEVILEILAPFLDTPAPSQRPAGEAGGLVERARVAVEWATQQLGIGSWRPTRSRIEGQRNLIRDMGAKIEADAARIAELEGLLDTAVYNRNYYAEERRKAEARATKAEADVSTAAARDVLAERRRQVEEEGWTPKHDDKHRDGSMLLAAKAYFLNGTGRAILCPAGERAGVPFEWPWEVRWWKPKEPRYDLVRAGALALAKIERIKRLFFKRASSRYVDAEAYYTLIIAEIERLDRAEGQP